MRACGLRSFAYRRYPAIHIAPPSPTPVSSDATGPDEHRATPGGDVAVSGPLPPEELHAAPAIGPAERAAGPGRAGLTAPVRLRRPKRPAAARADSVQEPVHQAGPSQGLRSRVAPAVTLAPSTRATASAQPAAPLAAPCRAGVARCPSGAVGGDEPGVGLGGASWMAGYRRYAKLRRPHARMRRSIDSSARLASRPV